MMNCLMYLVTMENNIRGIGFCQVKWNKPQHYTSSIFNVNSSKEHKFMIVESQLAYQANDILVNTRLITAINMAGRNTTSELEYFHSHLNRYIPKMQSFSYHGMLTRYV